MPEEVEKKAKELMAECHERGLVTYIGIANNELYSCVTAIDGQVGDIMAVICSGIRKIAEETKGATALDLADYIYNTLADYEKKSAKKGKKSNETAK